MHVLFRQAAQQECVAEMSSSPVLASPVHARRALPPFTLQVLIQTADKLHVLFLQRTSSMMVVPSTLATSH